MGKSELRKLGYVILQLQGGVDEVSILWICISGAKFLDRFLPYHPNGLRLRAFDMRDEELHCKTYFSIGGGLVVEENGQAVSRKPGPFPFFSAVELLAICHDNNMTISEVVMQNERSWRTEAEVRSDLLHIWQVVQAQ